MLIIDQDLVDVLTDRKPAEQAYFFVLVSAKGIFYLYFIKKSSTVWKALICNSDVVITWFQSLDHQFKCYTRHCDLLENSSMLSCNAWKAFSYIL